MVLASSRASDRTSWLSRAEVRSCGVCETRCRRKTEGDTERWIVVWHKIRSSLPASGIIDQYSV